MVDDAGGPDEKVQGHDAVVMLERPPGADPQRLVACARVTLPFLTVYLSRTVYIIASWPPTRRGAGTG